MPTLIPDYLNIDYNTLLTNLKTQLQNSTIFKDVNYEGSNISILIELLSYISELQTFYTNEMAKNQYMDTAEIYECIHRLAEFLGYYPKGYRSSVMTATVTVSGGYNVGEIVRVPAWYETTVTAGGSSLSFATTESTQTTASSAGSFSFDVILIQGEPKEYSYKGTDIVDNQIILPNLEFANNPDDTVIQIEIDNTEWTRVDNFYDDITEEVNTIYQFKYDKYKRYVIEFSPYFTVPTDNQTINITVLQSDGEDGNVAANSDIALQTGETFITNITQSSSIDNDLVSLINSQASAGGDNEESIDTIKRNAKGNFYTQDRNITADDYGSHLESRSDITTANVWGEQDIAPSGSVVDYNKVYITVIPSSWNSNTISTSAATWVESATLSADIIVPTTFNSTWENTLKDYLKPRKIITTYEVFEVPDLVYFAFDIGIRLNRTYNASDVINAIKNKLTYYFRYENQEFGTTINFMDIHNYILDTSEVSDDDNFTNVRGIKNFIIRDIRSNKIIYDNDESNYPRYTADVNLAYDNMLKKIELKYNQFPVFALNNCTFTTEG